MKHHLSSGRGAQYYHHLSRGGRRSSGSLTEVVIIGMISLTELILGALVGLINLLVRRRPVSSSSRRLP